MTEFGATGADATIKDINQVHQAVNRATGGFNLLGTAVGTAGGFLIGQAISKGIGMVTGLGRSMISSSAQAETLGIALETAVGDRAKQVYADLQKFAALTPFEFPELVQSTITLENFGIRANETIEGVGRTWTEVIGDTASAMGTDVNQVTQAVTDAVMGENERLKELGIRATYEGDQIKYTYMKNGKEMTAFADRNSQDMIAATIAGIWNDKYEGAMEKQSRTFAGKMSTLRDNWNMTMQRMGEGVFDFAKVGLTHANLFFDRFNVGLDKGLNPFQAGVRALKFSLQDIFGKGPVNKIWSGMESMFGFFESGGRKVFDVASGLKNIAGGIGAAFFEGDRERFFRQLPDWLQQSARYAGTVAEGFGDIYRSFREDGISGAIDSLFGSEGRQIVNAAVDLVVDAVPRLGRWLWDSGTDLASWLWSKIPGVSTPQQGDGTGGPEFDAQTKPFTVPVLMDLAANFGKWVWGKASDFGGWLLSHLPGGGATSGDGTEGPAGTSATPFSVGALIDIAADYGKTLWGSYGSDFATWFKNSVGELAASVEAAITVNTDENNAAFESGQETGKTWGEKFSEGLTAGFESIFGGGDDSGGGSGGGGGFVAGVFGAMGTAADWLASPHYLTFEGEIAGFVAGLATTFKNNFTSNMKLLFWDQPLDLGGNLMGWIKEGLGFGGGGEAQATGLYDELGNQIFSGGDSGGMFDGILADIEGGFEIFIGDLTGSAGAFKDDFVSVIKSIFPDDIPDIDFPDIAGSVTGWIGDEFGGIKTWLSENTPEWVKRLAEGDLIGAVKSVFGGGPDALVTGRDAFFKPIGMSPTGDVFTQHPVVGHPLLGDPMNPVTGPFKPGSETVVPARLDLDTSEAMTKLAALTGSGSGNQKSIGGGPFEAVFDLDTADASEKKTEAMLWGTTWAGSVYRSAFDINDSDAVSKKNNAFLYGMNWAGSVFTASFSVNLGPLEAAKIRVAELAAEISDLLPRSPAKKGPLARPISFGYIGDALKSAMRGMARDAEVGMSALTGTLAGPVPVAARTRPAGGTTINIITIPPDEWLELARAVERGESIDLNLARELAVRKAKAVS
jgi:hypothetical protein